MKPLPGSIALVFALTLLPSCAANLAPQPSGALTAKAQHAKKRPSTTPISHVIVIIQENRTVDNLFQFLPGAATQNYCVDSQGNRVNLTAEALTGSVSPSHTHAAFVTDFDNGLNDGWIASHCTYVPQKEVQPYYTLAEQYAFADNFFQTNQGPSFPAHQYLLSGASTISDGSNFSAAENPHTPNDKATGGCDSPSGSTVVLIDTNSGKENRTQFPCFIRNSIIYEAQAAGLTWAEYQLAPGAGFWKPADAVQNVWCLPAPAPCDSAGPDFTAAIHSPSTQLINDVGTCGKLASITYVTPNGAESDHAGQTDGSGPAYVASLVNAIGNSCFWGSSAIFVVWDDWGGWFDHVIPTQYNYYELGYRVPFIAISPYAKSGYISHTQHEFGSILNFIEKTFGLPSLGTTDTRADDLSDMFNFNELKRRFVPIAGAKPASFFARLPATQPDDDL